VSPVAGRLGGLAAYTSRGGTAMVSFRSPRFQGNVVLQETLDDPDTGTRKLQKHSDPTAVRLAQEAVYDLMWAVSGSAGASYPSRADFVDGDYGPSTERSVRDDKEHYRIVFPPGDPNGIVDGFTGPRTLMKLDNQIAWRDLVRDIIQANVTSLQQAAEPVALSAIVVEPPPFQPWRGSNEYLTWEATWGGRAALLVGTMPDKAFALHGEILTRWLDKGGCTGSFGPPTSDIGSDGSGGLVCTFQGGEITVDGTGQVVERPGPLAYELSDLDETWA
jgi:hypothetical protein